MSSIILWSMDKSRNLRTGRHCLFLMHVHLVFVTKYRRSVFTADMINALKKYFAKICRGMEAKLVECNGEADHIHLLVNYPPKLPVSKLVNSLKGATSRKMKNRFPQLQKYFWKGSLWSPSYFAGSCGGAPLDLVKKYVQSQRIE